MKSVTEFFVHKLAKGIESKTALAAEGKTPEEVEQSMGEIFKLEGDKLKIFFNSLEVANDSLDKLVRIRVVSFDEGESVPANAVKVDEHYYIPNYKVTAPPPSAAKPGRDSKGRNNNKGKRSDGPKSSPWGESPEEIAAKKLALKKKAQEK